MPEGVPEGEGGACWGPRCNGRFESQCDCDQHVSSAHERTGRGGTSGCLRGCLRGLMPGGGGGGEGLRAWVWQPSRGLGSLAFTTNALPAAGPHQLR